MAQIGPVVRPRQPSLDTGLGLKASRTAGVRIPLPSIPGDHPTFPTESGHGAAIMWCGLRTRRDFGSRASSTNAATSPGPISKWSASIVAASQAGPILRQHDAISLQQEVSRRRSRRMLERRPSGQDVAAVQSLHSPPDGHVSASQASHLDMVDQVAGVASAQRHGCADEPSGRACFAAARVEVSTGIRRRFHRFAWITRVFVIHDALAVSIRFNLTESASMSIRPRAAAACRRQLECLRRLGWPA